MDFREAKTDTHNRFTIKAKKNLEQLWVGVIKMIHAFKLLNVLNNFPNFLLFHWYTLKSRFVSGKSYIFRSGLQCRLRLHQVQQGLFRLEKCNFTRVPSIQQWSPVDELCDPRSGARTTIRSQSSGPEQVRMEPSLQIVYIPDYG